MFPELGSWICVKDGDNAARYIFDQHYSRHHYSDNRKPRLFVGPGEKLVLITSDYKAIFAWRKFISGDGQAGINCAIFRNTGPQLSSSLILEAEQIAHTRWPGERFYTYINPRKIKSSNPGYCFKIAGWHICGETKVNKLIIMEKLP